MITLGEALRRERRRREETQREAAERFGVTQASWSRWENDEKLPDSGKRVLALAEYLGLELGDVLKLMMSSEPTTHAELVERVAALERDVTDLRAELRNLRR